VAEVNGTRDDPAPALRQTAADSSELERLKQRVAELEKKAGASPTASGRPADPRLPPEERRAKLLRRLNDRVRQHASEAVDPAWSAKAVASLKPEMGSLAQAGGFVVGNLDCRTTLCRASIKWPNYPAAMAGYMGLLRHPFQLNCIREAYVPLAEGAKETDEYEGTMIFDCTGAR
jgi:hypothetical protein